MRAFSVFLFRAPNKRKTVPSYRDTVYQFMQLLVCCENVSGTSHDDQSSAHHDIVSSVVTLTGVRNSALIAAADSELRGHLSAVRPLRCECVNTLGQCIDIALLQTDYSASAPVIEVGEINIIAVNPYTKESCNIMVESEFILACTCLTCSLAAAIDVVQKFSAAVKDVACGCCECSVTVGSYDLTVNVEHASFAGKSRVAYCTRIDHR